MPGCLLYSNMSEFSILLATIHVLETTTYRMSWDVYCIPVCRNLAFFQQSFTGLGTTNNRLCRDVYSIPVCREASHSFFIWSHFPSTLRLNFLTQVKSNCSPCEGHNVFSFSYLFILFLNCSCLTFL